MSWVGIVLMVRLVPVAGFGGGVFYIAGAGIYYFERPNPVPGKFGFHEICHLFVFSRGSSTLFIYV